MSDSVFKINPNREINNRNVVVSANQLGDYFVHSGVHHQTTINSGVLDTEFTIIPTPVSIADPLSPFGEVLTTRHVPIIQHSPVNNILPANFTAYSSVGGWAGVTNKEFYTETGSNLYGYGAVQSNRSVPYKAGFGAVCRMTAIFPSGGIADSWQGAGLINLGDELSFGYNGADFGVWHRHHGVAEVQKLTLTNAAGGSETASITIGGTLYSGNLTAGSIQHNAYEIATFINTQVDGYNGYQNGSGVFVIAQSDGNKGTFSFSSSTASGSWSEITQGVTKTSTFIPQSEWNIDKCPGLNPTYGNVYQIDYQYLGYGRIRFSLEHPDTGKMKPVHIIHWENRNTQPSLSNPNLRVGCYAASVGSTSNIVVKAASMAAFVEGETDRTRNPRSFSNVKSVSTALTNIFSIRCREILNGYINQNEIQPVYFTAFTESTKGATIQVSTSSSIGETFFNDVADDLLSEYDITGTTVTGGRPLLNYVIPGNSTISVDLTPLILRLPPKLILTIAGKVNSGAASDVGASLVWYEDV